MSQAKTTPKTKKAIREIGKELEKYTPKQAAFFYWYSILGNGTKAALRVYYPNFPIGKEYTKLTKDEQKQYSTASTIAEENLRKHDNPVKLYLDQHGMDFEEATRILKEGLEATKTENAYIVVGNKSTITKKDVGKIEVPDFTERREWWDRFTRLLNIDVSQPKTQESFGVKTNGKTVEFIFQRSE